MKASIQIATIVACTFVLPLTATKTQAQAPTGDRIAVIDINYVFKNHSRFKRMVEDWKNDLKAVEAQMKKENDDIVKLAEQAKRFEIGSPDYKRLEADVAKRRGELQVKMQLQKKDLMEREAKMYLNVYNEIQNQVAYFAKKHNITLVLRFNREQIQSEDPRAIQQGLLRPVVYQNQIDITLQVLAAVNPQGTRPVTNGGGDCDTPLHSGTT